MTQTGLIDRVIEALGLLDDGYARVEHTPAKVKPLVKDADGAPLWRDSATPVSWECYSTCQVTLAQTLPTL